MADEISTIPPAWSREDANALLDHGLEKGASYIARLNGTNYELIYGHGADQAGKLVAAATGPDALTLLNWLKNNAAENSKCLFAHGDYEVSAKFSTTKKLRFEGEGLGTRIIRSGSGYDALDPTNLSLFNISWEDDLGVLHDSSFDPNTFTDALYLTGRREIKNVKLDMPTINLWQAGGNVFAVGGVAGATGYGYCKVYRISPTGKVEDLTYNLNSGFYNIEIVAAFMDIRGNIFVSTHTNSELMKLPYNSTTWAEKIDEDRSVTIYGINGEAIYGYLIFASGGSGGTNYQRVYRSTDMGESWTKVYEEQVNQYLFGVACHGTTILVGGSSLILRSVDYGASFSKIDLSAFGTHGFRNFAYVNGVWFVSAEGRDYYFVSLDEGLTWHKVANKLPGVAAYSSNNIHSNGTLIAIASRSDCEGYVSKNGATWATIKIPIGGSITRGVVITEDTLFIGTTPLWGPYADKDNRENCGNVMIIPIDAASIKGDKVPNFMWNNEAISADDTSLPLFTKGTSKQGFFFKTNTTGNLIIQVWDEQAGDFVDYDTKTSVTIDTLLYYSYELPVTMMRLKFSAAATVTAWAVLED